MIQNILKNNFKKLKKEKELYPSLFLQRIVSMILFVALVIMVVTSSPILFKISAFTGLSIETTGFIIYMIGAANMMYVNYKSRALLGNQI